MLSRAALKRMWFASIAHCFDAQNLPGSTPGHFVSSGPFSRLFRSNSVDLIFDARCTERGAASVPLGRLHLETDAPWCSIKRTHAGHKHTRPMGWDEVKKERWQPSSLVKDRCEPAHILQVAQVLAHTLGVDEAALAAQAYANSARVFRLQQ